MPYEVTFATGRKVTVHNAAFLNLEQVRERAINLHGDREYRFDPAIGRAQWFDIEVPAITHIQRMVEVYMDGGYVLVPDQGAL